MGRRERRRRRAERGRQARQSPPTVRDAVALAAESRAYHAIAPGERVFEAGVGLYAREVRPRTAGGLPVLLLHGFPDFWYGWRAQLPALADAGRHAVALDLRGYDRSEHPRGVSAYAMDRLVGDVAAVIRALGGRVQLVGHDWGGMIAWHLAAREPALVERLVIMNAPHPARFARALFTSRQLLRSWYALAFQIPWVAERLLRLGRCALLRRTLRRAAMRFGSFDEGDLDRYASVFAEPGTLTCAINYYRAAARRAFRWRRATHDVRITMPTLLVWGERDPYLGVELTTGLERWVPHLHLMRVPDAGHWVQLDAAERVNGAVVRFLGA